MIHSWTNGSAGSTPNRSSLEYCTQCTRREFTGDWRTTSSLVPDDFTILFVVPDPVTITHTTCVQDIHLPFLVLIGWVGDLLHSNNLSIFEADILFFAPEYS